ncbi:MAG: hypothetical protein JWM99_1978 [Verrucomicrobiales bacterium]|jgi:hypothetical protein|nr:hypothetical protein [Verrucomicrobiales bacterium]
MIGVELEGAQSRETSTVASRFFKLIPDFRVFMWHCGRMLTKTPAIPAIEGGQIWEVENSQIHILSLGKRLAHFKRLKTAKQKGVSIQLGQIVAIQEFLASKGAKLISSRPA